MRIAYFGRPGSYSHQIATKRFPTGKFVSCPTHGQVVDALLNNKVSIGVLPLDNSAAGVVMETIDTLVSPSFVHSRLKIQEQLDLTPDLALLSKTKSLRQIKRLYSHPFPLRYLAKWIQKNLPQAEIFETVSTSEAAQLASEQDSAAAVAGPHAAKIYKLDIVKSKLAKPHEYITRFCVVSTKPLQKKTTTHVACSFGLKHRPGALVHALSILSTYGLNLTRIISRPLAYRTGKFDPDAYLFWIDVDIGENRKSLDAAMKELKNATTFLDVLGHYFIQK